MEAKERLWFTADRKRLVGEGDPKAATLYAAPGDEVPEDMVKRFGLKDGRLPKGGAKAAPKDEDKAASKGDDKSAKPGLTVTKRPTG